MNRGDKAFRMGAFVHKLCPVIPLHKRPQKDMGNDETMMTKRSSLATSLVRAGAVWSGVGTLAVNTFDLRTKGGKSRQESSDLAHYQKV